MESPNRPYLSQVDEIRGLAAILVLLFHCLLYGYWTGGHSGWIEARNPIEALLIEGHSGVSLFMVLSGYILAKGTWKRTLAYRDFLFNRVIRIFPLMTVVVIATIYAKQALSPAEIFAPFLLFQNVMPLALSDPSGLVSTVWTISIEFQFYLVAPFLFIFVDRYGFKGYLLPFAVFIVCLRAYVQFEHRDDAKLLWQYPYFSIVGRIDQFLIGIYIAWRWDDMVHLLSRHRARAGAAILAVGLAGMMLLSFAENHGGGQYAWHWWRVPQQEIEGALWGAFIVGYILLDPLRTVPLVKGALRRVGVVSFSLYLLHLSVMTGVFQTIPMLGLPFPNRPAGVMVIAVGVILPLALAISTLSYAVIERPFLEFRRRYVGHDAPLKVVV